MHLKEKNKTGKVSSSNSKKKKIKISKRIHPLAKIAAAASAQAIRESKALGLDIVYMENGIIYIEKPDGSRKELKSSKRITKKPS